MQRSKLLNTFIVLLLLCVLTACKKEVETHIKEAPPYSAAGTNQSDIAEFQVQLNADSLKAGQTGKWTIVKGLVEEKVYFAEDTRPNTKFNGMPGETYELKWTVREGATTYSEAIVKINFKPLKAIIDSGEVTPGTRFNLYANRLDYGEWTINGKYAGIRSLSAGGIYTPDINSGAITFQGYAHTKYAITWTTHYGSKSADTTINITTGDYLESEALADLQLHGKEAEYENGHVTALHLSGSRIAWIMQDTVRYPAFQALTYLKRLEFAGSSLNLFPVVITSKYTQLEYLNLNHTSIPFLPVNIDRLKKLKELYIEYLDYGTAIRFLPDSFGNLESLEYFGANMMGLEDIPESFSKLKKLKYFEGYLNSIQRLPTALGDLSNLEVLMVSSNENIPASVSKLTKLKYLLFFTSSTSAKLPDDFGNLSALDTLKLNGPFRDLPNSLGNMNMKYVELSTPQLASLPTSFGNLKNLSTLQVTGLIKTLPASFSNLSNLQILIYHTPVESLPKDFGKLKKLFFMSCEYSNLKELPESFGDLDNLTELRLQMGKIAYLPPGFFNLQKIQKIDLANNKLPSLPDDFGKLKNTLQYLTIRNNPYPASDVERLKTLLPTTFISQ